MGAAGEAIDEPAPPVAARHRRRTEETTAAPQAEAAAPVAPPRHRSEQDDSPVLTPQEPVDTYPRGTDADPSTSVAARGRRAGAVAVDAAGMMTLVVAGSRYRFDLTNPGLELEMTGTPGQRGWRLQIKRRSMSPVTVGGRRVDGAALVAVIRQWRRDL